MPGRKGKNKATEVVVAPTQSIDEAAVDVREEEEGGSSIDQSKKQYDWKEGHQEIMADFWVGHPEFYDKSCSRYKDIQYKRAAVETFLLDMRNTFEEIMKPIPTYEQFIAHLRNMRTRFNRYKCKKSGQPAHTISAKEAFIMEKYQFLRKHIEGYRHLTHETHSFGRGHHSREEDDDDYDDDDAISGGSSAESYPQPGTSSSTSSATSTCTKGRAQKKIRKESSDCHLLLDRAQNLLGNINQPLSNHQKRVKEFVRFLETEILQVPEHSFNNCSMEVMFLVRNFQANGGVQGNQPMQSRMNQSMGMSYQVQPGGMSNQMQPWGISNQMQSSGMSNQSQTMSQGMSYGTQVNHQPVFHQSWRNGQNFASPGVSTSGTSSETAMHPPTCGSSNLGALLTGALNTSVDCESSFQVSDNTSRSTRITPPLRASSPLSLPQMRHSGDIEAE